MHEQATKKTSPPSEWQEFKAANADIQAIDAFVIDSCGNTAGKRLPVSAADSLYRDGVQLAASCLVADCRGLGHDAGGLGKSDGDPDGIARPITGTLCRAPWTSTPTAQVACHMVDFNERKDLWFDPRVILGNVVTQCRAAGLHPVVACELEFYLIDPRRTADGRMDVAALPGRQPARRAANLSLEAVEEASEFLKRVNEAAQAQRIPVSGAVAEYGVSQYEVNLHHVADPVLAADQAVLLKRLIKGVARSMGIEATFMAKPFMTQPGSGLHVHVSLVDEAGRNRFGVPGGEALLRHCIAGMQALVYDSFALFAPNFNSQRRYLGFYVPTARNWASNNRSVAFRIPAAHGEGRRIEHRVAGADASPHLTMAAILSALLHGVSHRLEATDPATGRANTAGDEGLPGGLIVALDRLERSAELAQYIPARYLKVYAETKRGEYRDLISEVFAREHDYYA